MSFLAGPGLALCWCEKTEAAVTMAAMATADTDVVEKCGRCVNCPFHTAPLNADAVPGDNETGGGWECCVFSSCYILGQPAAMQSCENCSH